MKSFQTLYTLYTSITNNTSSTNTTLGKQLINDTHRLALRSMEQYLLEKSATATTTASTQFYNLPNDYDKLIDVTITVGSYIYRPRQVVNRKDWDSINQTTYTSDIPQVFYIYNGQVGFYPTPASSSNTITFLYQKKVKDMTADDYTTGTVTTLANGGTALTASGTTFTAAMTNRYIRITSDGFWYPISAFLTTTTLTLGRAFQGTAIAAGSEAFTIGELPTLPETYQDMLVWKPCATYFKQQNDLVRAREFDAMYQVEFDRMRADYASKSDDVALDQIDYMRIENPNSFPRSIGT